MSLREKLLKYQAKDLIEVAEPHSDYTHEAKTIAIDIIKENIILVRSFLNHINCGENTLHVIIDQ